MVRLLYPAGMEGVLSSSPYELIKIPYAYDQATQVSEIMQKGKATFIGPGLGRTDAVKRFLKQLIPSLKNAAVIDADALTLYAEEPYRLPSEVIFTPHTGEMQTLLHSSERLTLNLELLKTCQHYAEKQGITLILKGAPTFIFHPGLPPTVNPTGDPGMATAGSGDVLTGLLASLLSQGLTAHQAACLGTYLHGLAGELAAEERGTSYGMMATDLIDHFAAAFSRII